MVYSIELTTVRSISGSGPQSRLKRHTERTNGEKLNKKKAAARVDETCVTKNLRPARQKG